MILEGIKAFFKDLGLVIDATNMAAGATVYSNWVDNVEWVRNGILLAQCDQQYDIQQQVRDSNSISAYATNIIATQIAVASPNWAMAKLLQSSTSTGLSAVFGYSVRFGLKNSSASPNTYGKLRVQLMGL